MISCRYHSNFSIDSFKTFDWLDGFDHDFASFRPQFHRRYFIESKLLIVLNILIEFLFIPKLYSPEKQKIRQIRSNCTSNLALTTI